MSLKGVNFQLSATNAGQSAFNSFNRSLQTVQKNVGAANAVNRSWNAGLNQNRRAIQQLGFQMTDFGVQIAGGQNAMLAFVQQGGQMLQVFGPMGAILAALLTVFGTLAIVLGKTGIGLEEVAGHFGVLEEEFMSVTNAVASMKDIFMDAGRIIVENLDLIIIAVSVAVGWFATKWVAAMMAASLTTGTMGTALRALAVSYAMNGAAATAAMVATTAFSTALTILSRLLPIVAIAGVALFVQWLMRTDEATEQASNGLRSMVTDAEGLQKATENLANATSNYVGSSKAASMSTFELMDKYGSLAFAARDALKAMAAVDEYETIMAMNAAVAASIGHILSLTNDQSATLYTQLTVGGQLAEESARRVEAAIRALDQAQGLPNQARAAAELVNQLMAAYGSIEAMPDPVRLVVEELSKQVTLAGEVTNATREATVAAYEFSGATGAGASGLANMVAQAWQLVSAAGAAAGALWNAVSAMNGMKAAVATVREGVTGMLPSWEGVKTYATDLWDKAKGMVAETRLHNEELATQYAMYGEGVNAMREMVRLKDDLYGGSMEVATGKGGGGGGGGGGGEKGKAKGPFDDFVEEAKKAAERTKQIFTDMRDTISGAMMGAFKSLTQGTKTFAEAAFDMLASIVDKIIEILMTPIFNNLATSLAGGILGGLGGMGATFDGGGFTGSGPRAGGLDGKGGYMAMVHPNETVVDHTKGQGLGGKTVNVTMNISTPNVESFRQSRSQLQTELARMVREGTKGL